MAGHIFLQHLVLAGVSVAGVVVSAVIGALINSKLGKIVVVTNGRFDRLTERVEALEDDDTPDE